MASQSLYRKWRSQTFDQLIGQEHVVRTLRNAIVEERVAHAYLFTGPRGVGKTSMARLLAKAVNCTAEAAQRPCGVCASCRAIADGHAVDVVEMDAASHTSVDDARELIERVQFRPTAGRSKVYVIDEVHMLSTAAFNALLKTLEEPPDHAIFVLATTEVHKVPITILSRCQRFTFTRHSIADIAVHLQRIAAEEELQLEPGVAEAMARSATGSMRDALGVLEQLRSFASGPIRLEQVQSLLGMTSAAEVNALIDALLASDISMALRAVNGVADQGADVRQFTRDLVERLRALMLLVAAGDQALLDVGDDELALLQAWADQADAALLVQWIKVFSNLDFQLRTSPYGHLPLELAVVEALVAPAPVAARPAVAAPPRPAPKPRAPDAPGTPTHSVAQPSAPARSNGVAAPPPAATPPVADPERPADDLPPPAATPPVDDDLPPPAATPPVDDANRPDDDLLPPVPDDAPPAEAELPAPPATTAALDAPAEETHSPPAPELDDPAAVRAINTDISMLEQVESIWPAVIRDVRPHSPTLQALLHSTRPLDVEDNTVVLRASSSFHKVNVEKAHHRQIVEDVLSKHMGGPFAIRCVTEEAETERRDLRSQIREARKDPRVKAAQNIFSADIIRIEEPE